MTIQHANLKLLIMKNSLYVIAGLLLIIWAIVFWGFETSGMVHILLALAGFIILVRLVLSKQLSK